MKNLLEKNALIPLALLCGCYIYTAYGLPAHDFANYYFGGKFLAQGHFSSWIYFPYEFNKAIAAESYRHIFASYAPNTPFLALFFLPFSFLPLAVAKLVFSIFSTGLLLFTVKRLADFYRIGAGYLLLIPIVFFVPIKNELLFGQVYFLLFFLLGETWMAYRKNKKTKAALLLSLAIMLKIFPVLLALAFLFRKKYAIVGYTAMGCSLLLFFSILFSSTEIWVFFMESVLPKASDGAISEAYVRNYQSVLMFLKEMLVLDPTENPKPLFNQPALFAALLVAFKIKVIAIGYYVSRKVKTPLFTLSFWMIAMLLLSPYGSTYGLILLMFPMLCVAKMEIPKWQKAAVFLLLLGICNIPVRWIAFQHFPFSYTRLFLLLLLLALACLTVWKIIRVRIVALAALVPMVALLLLDKPQTDNSSAVLGRNEPILIHDFAVTNHILTYRYWNEKGENTASVAIGASLKSGAMLHENDVFYNGSQITFEQGYKRKAIALDDGSVLYLSDHGRGIGFYNLRRIRLKNVE